MATFHISLSIAVEGADDVIRVIDALKNQLVGLSLEGYTVNQSIMTLADEPEDDGRTEEDPRGR